MSRFFIFKDITVNTMKNATNPFYPQLTMSDFSKFDSQTVEKCFYLWLIRKNNNDYVGLAKNTNTYMFNPAFLIDNWYYILPSKAKLMLSFDTNFERTPLINKCLQVKIYFYGSRDRFDENYLEKLKAFVGECLWYKFPELSYGEIDFEFHNCDEIFQEYHNVDQYLPTFYQIHYVGSDDVTMDLRKERAIHDKFQNCLIKTMKLNHKRRNPFKAKRNSTFQYPKYHINFKVEAINGILVKDERDYCSIPFDRKESHHREFRVYPTRKKAFSKAQKVVEKDTEEMRKEYDCFINEYNDFLNTLEQNFNTILSSFKDQTSTLTQRQQRELEKFLNKEQNFNTLLSHFKERFLTISQKQKRELDRSYLNSQDIEVI